MRYSVSTILTMLLQRLLFFGTILSLSGAYTYIGTEESLRENIADLLQGKLKFFDDTIPSYEGELSDITPENNSEYDFIVIGAGSAGSVMASRLSENKSYSVLLIEAGPKEYPIMDIPSLSLSLQASDQINWKYQTEPSDRFCLGFTNHSSKWPRGKVMGGSSVLNSMIATRGNEKDYNGWANVTGDQSWSYANMLKYLMKLENFNVDNVPFNPACRNKYGPLYISSIPYHSKLAEVFMEASDELGYSTIDYVCRERNGVSYIQFTVVHGERWSTNRAYLYPAKNRQNLFLTRESHVNKILINEITKEAYAVQFSKSGISIVVKARKEIILSAGAINSPQILMLSGIGPKQHLKDLGIEVLKDAPVGENLMDHIAYGGLIFKVNDSAPFENLGLLDPKNPAIIDYINKRNGTLATAQGFESLGYVIIDEPNSLNTQPNIELLFGPAAGIKDPGFSEAASISEENRNKMLADQFNHSSWTMWPMILQPKSRGKVLLQSKDPNAKPKLYPNYLDHPDDVKVLIGGIRKIIEFSKTNAFQKYGSELYDIPLPCESYKFDTDEYWECAIRTYSMTIYHHSGTCKMGREDDETAVLNSKLQVKGIKNLRVVDASVMPNIVSAHPHVPIVAIAEKIAEQIKQYWRRKY